METRTREDDNIIWVTSFETKDPQTGKNKQLRLLDGVSIDPNYIDVNDPDSAIPAYLVEMGFKIEERSAFVSAECVRAFLLSHLCFVNDIVSVVFRVTGRRGFPEKVTSSKTWIDVRKPTGKIHEFSPLFWTRLLRDISCYMSDDFVSGANPVLTEIKAAMRACGFPDSGKDDAWRSAFFAFAFACNLTRKNIYDLSENDDFMRLVSKDAWTSLSSGERKKRRTDFINVLSNLHADNEDAWVALLATSTFRKTPFVPMTFSTWALPAIERVEREKITMEQRKRAEEIATAEAKTVIDIHPPLLPAVDKKSDFVGTGSPVVVVVDSNKPKVVSVPGFSSRLEIPGHSSRVSQN